MIAYTLKLRHVENNAFNKMNHVAQHVAGLRYCENTESVHGRKKQDSVLKVEDNTKNELLAPPLFNVYMILQQGFHKQNFYTLKRGRC